MTNPTPLRLRRLQYLAEGRKARIRELEAEIEEMKQIIKRNALSILSAIHGN